MYSAAMTEDDKGKVPSLILEAERAIVLRARELFAAAGDNIEEEENLDDALYALKALKNCLAVRSGFAAAIEAKPLQDLMSPLSRTFDCQRSS